MGELGELLEKVREEYEKAEPTEVKRLSKKAKCNRCHYSALCLAASFQEVVERLKLFVCPECKNLFATFYEEPEDPEAGTDTIALIREVPLPGCAAFVFACQNHICGEACRNAQESSRPTYGRGILDKYRDIVDPNQVIGIGTPPMPGPYTYPVQPIQPLAPATPGIPNGNNDMWYGTKTYTSDSTADIKVENVAGTNMESQQERMGITQDRADAFAQGYSAVVNALNTYHKQNK